ncbi:NmrA family NAD(P)-binding protein [Streptomyces avicenniae]|uniref:NmrA family NAD(P)-binding protein n=1 Tax=Streptomyces avicenniae TaxID=500153 RepID=UPI0006997AA6|nr:NmrA family NAD(P)-binding protein [Streptomyces avicenniae]
MIVVTGATGSIGTRLVRRLTAAGADFRAVVRDARSGAALGCPYAVGDLDRPETLAAAFAGADRLLLNGPGAIPTAGPQPMIRQQKDAIDAAVSAGVAHIVKVSALGARPGAKLSLGAHAEIEAHLAASGVAWSLLRPTGYMENFFTGQGSTPVAGDIVGPYGDGRVAYVAADDVAACAAAVLTGAPATGGTYAVSGPEALDHAEIAALLTAALGRPVAYRDVPAAQRAAELRDGGLPPGFVADLVELWAEMAAGAQSEVTTAVRDLTGVRAVTFEEFLRDRAA